MRKRAPRDFNGRTEVRKDGSVAVKTDGRTESSPRIAERDGPSRLPYITDNRWLSSLQGRGLYGVHVYSYRYINSVRSYSPFCRRDVNDAAPLSLLITCGVIVWPDLPVTGVESLTTPAAAAAAAPIAYDLVKDSYSYMDTNRHDL